MSFNVRFAPDAERDLVEAYAWYEDQSTGLGTEFLRQINIQEARLRRNPLVHAVAYAHIRRVFLGRFPYALHFEIMDDLVLVLACIHQHRSPRIWPQVQ